MLVKSLSAVEDSDRLHAILALSYSGSVTPEAVADFLRRTAPQSSTDPGSHTSSSIASPGHGSDAPSFQRSRLVVIGRRWSAVVTVSGYGSAACSDSRPGELRRKARRPGEAARGSAIRTGWPYSPS